MVTLKPLCYDHGYLIKSHKIFLYICVSRSSSIAQNVEFLRAEESS